jgi:hypothetical protein
MANGTNYTSGGTDDLTEAGQKPDGKHTIIQPTIHRPIPARLRGPFSSAEYNDFTDATHHDIVNLSSAVNANSNKIERALVQVHSENAYLKRRIDALQKEIEYRQFHEAGSSGKVTQYFDLHKSSSIFYSESVPTEKRASYDARFGELALPANAVENKLFNFSLRTGHVAIPSDLVANVTGIFDKLNGDTAVDYEYGGTINGGNPLNACNGMNQSVWIRKVTFPISSNVQEVECQMTISVPAGISQEASVVDVVPFPEGSVDVTQVSTSPNLSSAFVNVDGFTENKNAGPERYRFSPRTVEQIRVRLRSRNWTEQNGKKVFTYGLQELGLKLVDYSKTFVEGASFGNNITGVIKMNCPSGYNFRTLHSIDTAPAFLMEDPALRNVRLVLSSTPDFTGSLWDSSLNSLPQNTGNVGVNIQPTNVLYGILIMKFVDQVSGLNSPFFVGNSPWINAIGLTYTT